jgi:hypothetical protein
MAAAAATATAVPVTTACMSTPGGSARDAGAGRLTGAPRARACEHGDVAAAAASAGGM